jgi:hypothetical protein
MPHCPPKYLEITSMHTVRRNTWRLLFSPLSAGTLGDYFCAVLSEGTLGDYFYALFSSGILGDQLYNTLSASIFGIFIRLRVYYLL